MRQQTFAEGAFEIYAQPTRRAAFPADRERVVPWSKLCTGIAGLSQGRKRPVDGGPDATTLVANVRGQVRPRNGKWPERLSDNRVKHPKSIQNLDVDDHACEGLMKIGLLQTFLKAL